MDKINRGFTLFEMIVAIGIFIVLVLLSGQVFFATLRGSTKTEVVREVRQNADFAVSVMERQLHNAANVKVCDGTQVSYFDQEGVLTSFSCVSGADSYIASGGARLTNPDVAVASCSITCPQTGVVEISFTVRQKATSPRPEEAGSYSVSTRVNLRNQ